MGRRGWAWYLQRPPRGPSLGLLSDLEKSPMDIALNEFNSLLDAAVAESSVPAQSPRPPRRRRPSAPDLEVRIRQAVSAFHQGDYLRCMASLRHIEGEAPGDGRVEAFLAASRAFALGEMREAVKTCVGAVKRGTHVADVCCALGAVLLKAGDRSKAVAVFRKGLADDPLHPYLRARLRELGLRRPPVFCSLPRSHVLNRVFGILRARLTAS